MAQEPQVAEWDAVQSEIETSLRSLKPAWCFVAQYPVEHNPDDGGADIYVQFLKDPAGDLRCEAVSNKYLAGESLLTPEQDGLLVSLGWHQPETGDQAGPNYWRALEPNYTDEEISSLAATVTATLRDVYHCESPKKLRFETVNLEDTFSEPAAATVTQEGESSQGGDAAAVNPTEEFLKHLEHLKLLGYSINADQEVVLAAHPIGKVFLLKPSPLGLFHIRSLPIAPLRTKKKGKCLQMLEEANRTLNLVKVYLGDGSLVVESLFVGPYEKERYALFLGAWDADNSTLQSKFDFSEFAPPA